MEGYPDEVNRILARYPEDQKRAAIMPLLYLAQSAQNYLRKEDLADVAELCEVSTTDVASVAGFYTLYHDAPGGKYRLQVCTDLPCALRGADRFLEELCENVGVRVGETSADGAVTIEEVKCLAGCHRAPMFQVQSSEGISYHENQTVASALELVEELRRKAGEAEA